MKKVEQYRHTATTIGNRICRDAIWHNDTCNWVGLAVDINNGRKIYNRALPPDFYDGVAGTAFFLLQLYRTNKHPAVYKTIKGAINQLISSDNEINSNGFFSGNAGAIFTLKTASVVLRDKGIERLAAQKLIRLITTVKNKTENDIISGVAGIILFLLYYYKNFNKQTFLLKTAISLGNRLIERADKTERGYSWKTLGGFQQNLTGFAHGASGIGAALMELYAVSKEEKFLSAVGNAFRYEDSFFNMRKQNWPDFRFTDSAKPEAEQSCGMGWCLGAPGIGVARLRAYEITGDKKFLVAAENAAATTATYLNQQSINDYSLCHGLTGNALFLLKAAKTLKKKKYYDAVIKMADKCIEQFINRNIPFPNGYLSDRESPCLMQGSSGIGYFFLQLYDPLLFPSLLSFNW